MQNPIISIPSGFIDVVNDEAPGQFTAPSIGGGINLLGQRGQIFEFAGPRWSGNGPEVRWRDNRNYGGVYQYVQRHPDDATTSVVGQLAFFPDFSDNDDEDTPARVTTSETGGSTANALKVAGVFLTDDVTPGNWTIIQIAGTVSVMMRAALTVAASKGCAVFAAAAGGADLGFGDVLGSADPVLQSDWVLLAPRYLGTACETPVAATLSLVDLSLQRYRR